MTVVIVLAFTTWVVYAAYGPVKPDPLSYSVQAKGPIKITTDQNSVTIKWEAP